MQALITCQSFTNHLSILTPSYVANHFPIIYQSSTNALPRVYPSGSGGTKGESLSPPIIW